MSNEGNEFLKSITDDLVNSTSEDWVEFTEKYSAHLSSLITLAAGMMLAASTTEGLKTIPALEEKITEKYDGERNVSKVIADFGVIFMSMATAWARDSGIDPDEAFVEFVRIAETSAREFVYSRGSAVATTKLFEA